MAITPSTTVYLIKAPLEYGDNNTLNFANATAQHNYFMSLPKIQAENFTYQRENSVIRCPAHIDDILQYNYVAYQNENYTDKWFYAFIVGMNYVNDNVTEISISTDSFQTWQFELEYKPCFVEREHVNNDAVGVNTVPEGLELGGGYVENNLMNVGPVYSDIDWGSGYEYEGKAYLIAFQVSELLESMYNIARRPQNYNGIYSGLYIIAVDNAEDAETLIDGYAAEGKSEAIISCFLTFPHFFDAGYSVAIGTKGYQVNRLYPAKVGNSYNLMRNEIEMTGGDFRFSNLDGYTPKNNKLKTYPYCYYLVDNNAGQTAIYKNELFDQTYHAPQFNIMGALGQGNSIKLVPVDYNGNAGGAAFGNYQHGIQAGKLPVCAWVSDYYLNWQTQNAVNMIAGTTNAVIGGAASGAAGGPVGIAAGAGVSLLTSTISNLAQMETAKLQPDTANGNVNVCDLNIGYFGSMVSGLFTIKPVSIKYEFAQIIDNFFSMYGYKVNMVKVPNVTGRANWNYVKTVGCYIGGDIPQEDLNEIKAMFDSGITIWHNPNTFLDYSQNNGII